MTPELDEKLCKKYPKLFKDRHGDMTKTCMVWGFSHDDGWYNIINALCSNIQNHIDYRRKERLRALRYNRALKRALAGDVTGLQRHYSPSGKALTTWVPAQIAADIKEATYREVPKKVHQVVVNQVKEKFGALRFYYTGGDDNIYGMVRMAESMSEVTCEECGSPGESRGGGWVRTLCDTHAKVK